MDSSKRTKNSVWLMSSKSIFTLVDGTLLRNPCFCVTNCFYYYLFLSCFQVYVLVLLFINISSKEATVILMRFFVQPNTLGICNTIIIVTIGSLLAWIPCDYLPVYHNPLFVCDLDID